MFLKIWHLLPPPLRLTNRNCSWSCHHAWPDVWDHSGHPDWRSGSGKKAAGSPSCCQQTKNKREWSAAAPSWTSFGGSHWQSSTTSRRWMSLPFPSHTLETNKKQLMLWVEKGQPGPVKAHIHATRSEQIVLSSLTQKAWSTRITSPGAKRSTPNISTRPW